VIKGGGRDPKVVQINSIFWPEINGPLGLISSIKTGRTYKRMACDEMINN